MMRVSQPAAAGRRTSMLAKASTVALLGLVCIVGFVALHNVSSELPEPVAAIPQARHQLLESAMLKLEQQEVHNEVKLAADLQALVQDKSGSEVVSRKQLHEVSEKIATAVRASHNVMDVRKLQEVGSVRPCGPKRPPTNTPRRPPRPCVPTPPNAVGTCQLCVVYRFKVNDIDAATICDPPQPALFLNILNTALTSQYPDLFNKLDTQTPNCTVGKPFGGQQQYAIHGKYCVGPFAPDYNPKVEDALTAVTSKLVTDLATKKVATPQDACANAVVQASSSVVVGQDTQSLTVTFECEDVPEPTVTKTFATSKC